VELRSGFLLEEALTLRTPMKLDKINYRTKESCRMRALHSFRYLNQTRMKKRGYNGGESVGLAVIAFGITIWEHHHNRQTALELVLLTIIVFCGGMLWLWRYEKRGKH
jgi:hypothetical protein